MIATYFCSVFGGCTVVDTKFCKILVKCFSSHNYSSKSKFLFDTERDMFYIIVYIIVVKLLEILNSVWLYEVCVS